MTNHNINGDLTNLPIINLSLGEGLPQDLDRIAQREQEARAEAAYRISRTSVSGTTEINPFRLEDLDAA